MAQFTFFQNQTTNGDSPIYNVQDGGYRIIKATGTFGGASVSIFVDFGDGNFAPILSYAFTMPDTKEIQPLKPGIRLKAVMTSASGTTDVTLMIL